MATRLKTVQYAFPTLASITNNTLTNFTQITIYLPESSVVIKKAWVDFSADDIITSTGGSFTTKTIDLSLGAATYTSTLNANTYTHSAENLSLFLERDFTTHFTTNWTGTSMTCDVRVRINQSTGATLGLVNAVSIVNITYEYDDASTTHLKTVWIPLNAPATFLPTTKTSHDTIPALDTYLPEVSKTYRDIFIVTQANTHAISATDHTVTYELSSLGTQVTGNYEAALISDRWSRYLWNITTYITTDTTHTFNVWASITARHHSMQAWMVVTYEFDASTTTSVMNSLMLPMEVDSPMGGPLEENYQRSSKELFIQESNITFNKLACYVFWQAMNSSTSLNARVGNGSFIPYALLGGSFIGGNKGLMVRNDSDITLGRGRNSLTLDLYSATTTKEGNVGSFWIVNYTSDKHSSGVGAHNHTVLWPVYLQQNVAASNYIITTPDAVDIPESLYFVTGLGMKLEFMAGAVVLQGVSIKAERLSGIEGNFNWERFYADMGCGDGEAGLNTTIAQSRDLFARWPGDTENSRLFLKSGRRYMANVSVNGNIYFNSLTKIVSYHSILYSVTGNITNSNEGEVTIGLVRHLNKEKVLSTTITGNGPYSFTWYDNTEPLYVEAYESNAYKGRSGTGIAS